MADTGATKQTLYCLLRRYWQIPERQVETSVVLRLPDAVQLPGLLQGERGTS